jgi:hypothetical protein
MTKTDREVKEFYETINAIKTKEDLKNLAVWLSKHEGIKRTHAHEIIARCAGYNTYNHFLSTLKETKK